ncbi:MAG: AAA family ATPase [Firmicutes bacterium]|nr:AAA family ATPase [Bacillota bacterium]
MPIKELTYKQLKNFCDARDFDFKTTKELEGFDEVIGQERALEALKFGLRVKNKGFNIFVSGLPGTGKTEFIKNTAQKIAETEKIPDDICYVYNFSDSKFPKILTLPAGYGKVFRNEMEELINYLRDDLPKVFSAKSYELKKADIIKKYQDKKDILIKKVSEQAQKRGFCVKLKSDVIFFMPMVDDEIISEEQFENLPQEQKDLITKNSLVMQNHANEIMNILKANEKNMNTEIEALEYSIGLFEIGRYLNDLFDKYGEYNCVVNYLQDVKENLLDNIKKFVKKDEDEETQQQMVIPLKNKKDDDEFLKYKVNVLVDNSDLICAPVIVDFNASYFNLCGEIEYENEFGNLTTDFTKIKAGLLHKANGGYLILQASDIFKHGASWEAIQRFLKTGQISIEPPREVNTGFAISSLSPEKFQANVKIIIVGSEIYYRSLYELDDDFAGMFKILADFDYETDLNKKSIDDTLKFIKNFIVKKKIKDLDAAAVAKIIEYSSRIAESQKKLSTRYNLLAEIITEADAWATLEDEKIISEFYIKKAIQERNNRLNMYENKLTEMINEDYIMIATQGEVIGQINGLAVLDTGNYTFGKPSRITATTYVGKAGIINIEKEAEMSGNIHDKGMQVLTGYLGQTYAQDFPLSVSCRICFEQNYSGVDGDSASSTELYAVLSSLSDLPIRQDIAVTGSINQKGEIQVIGGVTYKIEGFFELCKKRGLTGTQGVIIPEHNVNDLVLNDEVIEAVKHGQFHIYPVKNIDEGIEILTGVRAGERDFKGNYPADSVHGLAMQKLKRFYEQSSKSE